MNNIVPFTARSNEPPPYHRCSDDLAAARGIFWAVVISVIFWSVAIATVLWSW